MKRKSNVFVCSKPLQYFNILNVLETIHFINSERRFLIIVGSFINSKAFYDNIKRCDTRWNKVIFANNKFTAYFYLLYLPFHALYSDSDNSTILGILHFFKKFRFYVFEEGVGTYFPQNTDRIKKGLRRYVDDFLGVGKLEYTSSYLDGIFLYRPDVYMQMKPQNHVKLIKMEYAFSDFLMRQSDWLISVSGIKKEKEWLGWRNKKILLYITDWIINPQILAEIEKEKSNYDIVVVKPHPHIKDKIPSIYNINVICSNIMVELIIAKLLNNNNEITVFHEISTSVLYFTNDIKVMRFPCNLGVNVKNADVQYTIVSNLFAEKIPVQ